MVVVAVDSMMMAQDMLAALASEEVHCSNLEPVLEVAADMPAGDSMVAVDTLHHREADHHHRHCCNTAVEPWLDAMIPLQGYERK